MHTRSSRVCTLSVLCVACACGFSEPTREDVVEAVAPLARDAGGKAWAPSPWWPGCREPEPAEPVCLWQPYAEGLSGANVWSVQYDARTPGLAFANAGGAIWRSTDGGVTWAELAHPEYAVTQLVPFGADPQQLLAAASGGLLESSDGGATFRLRSLDGLALTALSSAPSRPSHLYAAVDGSGLLRSTDAGASWLGSGSGYPFGNTVGVSVHPDDDDFLVAAIRQYTDQGANAGSVAHSSDGGATWTTTLAGHGFVNALARCPNDPNRLLAATMSGVASSDDAGLSWSVRAPADGTTWVYGVEFTGDDCASFYLLQAGEGPRLTNDGGASYGPPLVEGLTALPTGSYPGFIAIDPSESGRLVLATHAGLYGSANAGASWTEVPGILHMAVTWLASPPDDPSRLWLASWGTGIWQRLSPSEAWSRIPFDILPLGHAQHIDADPFVPGRIFVSATALHQSFDAGRTFTTRAIQGNPFGIAFDPRDSRRLYLSTQVDGILLSTDGGGTWTRRNGNLTPWLTSAGTSIDVRVVAIDPTDPNTLYAATNGRGVYRSHDDGQSWDSILEPDEAVLCMVQVTEPAPALYACVNGVQSSADGGDAWFDASAGLGDLVPNALLADDESAAVYATTDDGVFVKHAGEPFVGLDTHCLAGAGAPAISVDAGQRWLVVAAGGRVYRRPL